MNFLRNIKSLPTAEELIRDIPLSQEGYARILRDRREVRDILAGRDPRMLVIVGPCSAWPDTAFLEYARRLRGIQGEVSDALKIVLRTYIQKPRTAKGWTGPVNQPDPFSAPDIREGMRYSRSMMVEAIEMGLAIADEALFTHNAKGFLELLSWVAIGARSSEDQEHRIWASAIGAPVGLKNPTSGCIPIGVNSVCAAQSSHIAVFDGFQVETSGNPYAHLVLRGGGHGPNYHLRHLYRARGHMWELGVENPAILIDASHDNSRVNGKKSPEVQIDVVREVFGNLREHPELQPFVRGFLLESFLKPGSQSLTEVDADTVDRSGLSITDPCLGWERTMGVLYSIARRVEELGSKVFRRKIS
ncbi:MAG: 3-deoxy-7-phosphoheptulonate synthase [Planctomycetes bacterium]|jgi:3-deoxy-7-phosphoheptulonate synthase|nr:3-deoxy-7-phosphoheptulonate synthase [Planctomycetota bacterium]